MTNYAGFDWQNHLAGSCARFSVKHALLCLGIPSREGDITDAMGTSRLRGIFGGNNADTIKDSIKAFGCSPIVIWEDSQATVQRKTNQLLRSGIPIIVCVNTKRGEGWGHWAVLSGRVGGDYFWIDSDDEDLIGTRTWPEVMNWLECVGDDNYPYYLIGVKPKKSTWLANSLVSNFGEAWECLADADLCEHWGEYIAELNDFFEAKPSAGIAAQTFFARYERAIISGASELTDDMEAIEYELNCFRRVATIHRLRIQHTRSTHAVASLAAVIGQRG